RDPGPGLPARDRPPRRRAAARAARPRHAQAGAQDDPRAGHRAERPGRRPAQGRRPLVRQVSLPPAPRHPRRLVLLGTPATSVVPLRALVDAGHDIALVVSQPDRRRGRGSTLSPSPVKAAALELGLPVTDAVDDALEVGADLGVVVAFG